ncbi:KpsF/GutQ family sugar-phosphate isomerase [Flavobacteriaceae bacterium]|jgi:arabinose-5-phosphate isomerase|uniref:KpsF/GutQ family sugar-phosphate isomerase n=1 Tax=Formosa sp. Hel3_A1_48 TaxID=1336795 RepID=UPI00084E170F|nr:KpsF/GutQ family sugar-phosphate isomerase [Formosa sp. Hel3_A1_48]MDC0950413.1 KpsF/GutQ family sugar-phosphate isomerase [Flavobacteriaceae bacterium]
MKTLISKSVIIEAAKRSISEQGDAIKNIVNFLDDSFAEAVELILKSNGRVIITGIGKSAIIANKIVATLNSTGTPSIFMHAADAIHGDLGLVQKKDIIICISKSGNTPEIKVLVPLLKRAGNPLIAITGNKNSFLGEESDFIFNSYVDKEVCPNNLAPTTSTTAQLVIGDALAVCLLQMRDFSSDDFAKYHPGGALGKKLFLTVRDLAMNNEKPNVGLNSNIKDVIIEISEKRLGVSAVVEQNKIKGIITDGDLRRMLAKTENFTNLSAIDIMTKNPKSIDINAMAVDAMQLMEKHEITQLLVTDNEMYAGVVHLHDLMKEGIL